MDYRYFLAQKFITTEEQELQNVALAANDTEIADAWFSMLGSRHPEVHQVADDASVKHAELMAKLAASEAKRDAQVKRAEEMIRTANAAHRATEERIQDQRASLWYRACKKLGIKNL